MCCEKVLRFLSEKKVILIIKEIILHVVDSIRFTHSKSHAD